VIEDFERCYRAVESKDRRFDGWIYTGVTSTGIYCRPSCPATTPKRKNVRFFRNPAAAQEAGLRACKRCRPDASPGSPEWDARADLVGRTMRLIADGVIDREGVGGLAHRLGYAERQVRRQLTAEVGAGPIAIARAQRAQTARTLIESTNMPMSDVAFAAGFSSIRQFNDVVREVYALTPTELRSRRGLDPGTNGSISVRLPFRSPYPVAPMFEFLAERAIAGIEEVSESVYRRAVALPHGEGVIELSPEDDNFRCRLSLSDVRDLSAAVQRCRSFLDLDADPSSIADVLTPSLRKVVERTPGRRVPGAFDGFEMAIRALVGQQISVRGARTILGSLVARSGRSLKRPNGGLTHLFPTAADLAADKTLELPMPQRRRDAIADLSRRITSEELVLDRGTDRAETRARLLQVPGIGTWTAEYVAMRALGDPDAFPVTDLGIRKGAVRLGLPDSPSALGDVALEWAPWRAYAALYLWSAA
jgi:AraC family transcriptional regulator of adaptative response / DNA-3-methyladenine glycosylase II